MKSIKRLPGTVCSSLRSSVYLFDLTRVVEELIFNSLDAGSTKVCMFIDVGGCCVKVEDNGCGITREGLVHLGEKYATSKVHHAAGRDVNVEGFSYRGETLGSLSDISLLEVITKARGMPNGYHKIMKGWKSLFLGIDDHRQNVGTTVIVRDLFYNQAVRRRYMQSSPKKVLYSVKKCVIHAALVHPQVSFTVIDIENDTELLSTVSSTTPLPLISNYFGSEVSSSLDEINISDGVLKLSGYLSRPTDMFSTKALQQIYINSRLIRKGPMHKLIERLATDHQNSSNIYRGESEFQSAKRHKIQGHAAYMLKLSCPISIYDLTIEPSKTDAEFKDWTPILSFIRHAVISFWKRTSGHISQESNKNENCPYNRVEGDTYTAEMSEKSIAPKKKCDLQSDWNFIPESPPSCSLKMPAEDFDVYEIQESLAGCKRFVEDVKPYRHMPSSSYQVDWFSKYMVHDTQDISCPMEDHSDFQKYSMYKTSKLDNDFAPDNILHPHHNLVGADKDDGLFSTWEVTSVDEIVKHRIHDNENSAKISFISNTSWCPSVVRKPELLDNVDGSEFLLDENDSDDLRNEKLFSLDYVDDTDTAYCSGSSCYSARTVCRDNIATSQPSFMVKKCQTKEESDFFARDYMKDCYEEEKHLTKENKMHPTAWTCDFIGDLSHSFIDSDWYFGSPCYTNGSVSRTIEQSDKHAFEGNHTTDVTSCSDCFGIADSEESPEYFQGQSGEESLPSRICKTSTVNSSLGFSPDKTTVNKYPSDRIMAELNVDWLYVSSANDFPSISSSAKDYTDKIDSNIPLLINGQEHCLTARVRSRRSHSAPPFCKCKRKFSVVCHWPSTDSGEATLISQNASHSCETGIAFEEFSKPCALLQSYMEQGLAECSPTYHRCEEAQPPQVSDIDGFEDFVTEKLDASEVSMTKWRYGNLEHTCAERPENFSDKKDDILDISSGLLNLAGSFLEPESINKDFLEDAKVLLQLDKKFIPIVAGGNLAVVDQHAADERIRLEELRQKILSGECIEITHLKSEQELVLPEMGFQLLQNYEEQIRRWGWTCSIHVQCSDSHSKNLNILKRCPRGATLVAVPCVLGITLTDKDLIEFLEQLAETDGSATTPPSVNRVLNLKACRGAIMFGDSLLPSECSLIIEELKATSLCFQCAHGRPTTAPLVNIVELHKQLDRLTRQSWGQARDWHGIFRHKPTYKRARLRLKAAKRLQAYSD